MHQSPKTAAPTPAEPNTPDTKAKEEEKPAGALSPEPEVVYTNRRESEGELVLKAPPRKAEASSPKTLTTDSKKRLSLSGNTDPISAGGLQTFDEVDTSSPIVKAKPKPVSSPLAKNGKPPLPNASKKTTETKDTADGSPVAPAPRHAQAGRRTVSSYVEEDDDLFEVAPTSSREDPADLDDDDDEEDEGLLEGFRPEGFDARRGRRTRSSIVFYINEMDSFSSSDEMVGDSALFRRDYMSLSALDRSAAGTAQPVPKITLDDYKAPRNDEYTLRPPSFKARTGHPYGTSSVAASAKSVLSSLAYDPYGLNSSTTSGIWGGGGGGGTERSRRWCYRNPRRVSTAAPPRRTPPTPPRYTGPLPIRLAVSSTTTTRRTKRSGTGKRWRKKTRSTRTRKTVSAPHVRPHGWHKPYVHRIQITCLFIIYLSFVLRFVWMYCFFFALYSLRICFLFYGC
ncbi:hypothetical protein ADEAN_000132800 [Angomonas deanei]|uniref:Uncharacterized protein n=1 Tax=Angomonas deanei TaxID=59799 RepID=A0A7G2C301_9TRYP|nr:hypothetical protein ADEAN_000132800 [Angomonas deanei]